MLSVSRITNRISALLIEQQAYDRARNYVHFDRLWWHPAALTECADLLTEYLRSWLQNRERISSDPMQLVILSPDTVRSNFGMIPISVLVAAQLGCRFAVWKEYADARYGTPAIVGPTDIGPLDCIVLQDVISRGHTLLRMAQSLRGTTWHLRLYLGAVLNNAEGEEPVRRTIEDAKEMGNHELEFAYVTSTQQLRA